MRKMLSVSLFFVTFLVFSQKKTLQTQFITETITIDGKISEPIWNNAQIATDFISLEPDNGNPIPQNRRTEVKVLYNNDAVYVAATMYDDEPNKILKEISQRDDFGTSDVFGIFINGFNDGQQDFRFIVNAADGQADCVATETNGEDFSWDAIWASKATITNFGWVVEMKIPYAALRFSSEKKQKWGVNFFREIKRDRQKYTWTFIDPKVSTFIQQAGILEGIENIKTPTRLFLIPYSSYYVNANKDQKTKGTIKGGMDIKYGINDAFTLDMILVPDFGQTKYDNVELNLGPFEQTFNENRPFFTEGTDLFSKGNLLYSRRIGGPPSTYPTTTADEEVTKYPSSVSLINAFKISGRTKNGLGIGVLNAVTETTVATVRNTLNQTNRNVVVEPLTNYNVLVFDQRFQKNSSISFINTNVIRNGHFRDANVSGLVWDLNTKANTFNVNGDFKYSVVNRGKYVSGLNSQLNFAETSGKYRFSFGGDITTRNYDIDDLGVNFQTNYYSLYANTNYRILKPNKYFNSFRLNLNAYSEFQKETGHLQSNNLNLNVNLNDKKNNYFGFGLNANPFENYDYYEPRAANKFVITPTRIGGWLFMSTNYNNRFAIDFNPSYAKLDEAGRTTYGFYLGPRYRFNNRFSLNYDFNFFRQNNNKGFVATFDNDENAATEDVIVFGNRRVINFSNSLGGKYSITSRMNFNISVRHYWSYSQNSNYLKLEENGRLSDLPTFNEDKNREYYSWNLDLSFSWWFAPGSQMSILYRNNSAQNQRNLTSIDKDFGKKVTNLLNNDALNNTLSISVRYFIDYNQVRH